MSFRHAAMAAALIGAAALAQAADKWKISYFYDKPEQNFDIADMECPAAGLCFAAGAIEETDKFNPYAVITADAGAHWTPVRVSDLPTSLFYLNANLGWMVAQKGIWQTRDGGRTWKKLHGERDVRRLFFLDENHGFAVGVGKLLETTNGGESWREVASAKTELARQPSEVTLEWVFFADAQNGMVVGEMTPGGANRVPAWLEPPRGSQRGPTDVVVLGRTTNGGATWSFSSIARTDDLINVVFRPPSEGLWLVFQPGGAESRSEIVRCGWNSNNTTVLLRDTDALVADVVQAGKTIDVAAIARQGRLLNLPVPGKMRVYAGPDFEQMQRVDVDYRAVARRAQFAAAPDGNVFLGTDTGMILQLAHTP